MKTLLNLMFLLVILVLGVPQEAQASCCSTEDSSCTIDFDQDHDEHHNHDEPCGNNCCDCICCGSISFLFLKKAAPATETSQEYHPLIFQYKSLHDALFSASIWQPPKLG